jgi:hypothetical protein
LKNEQETQRFKENVLNDTGLFAREVLGYNYTKDEKTGALTRDDHSGVSKYGKHREIIDFIDASADRRKMLQAPRGALKTTIAQAWVMRLVLKNPNLRVLWASETYSQALTAIGAIKSEFDDCEVLRNLFGDLKVKGKWATTKFTIAGRTLTNQKEATFQAGGIDKALTGGHFDIIICDDLVSWNNVRNAGGMTKVLDFFRMVEPLLDPGGFLLVTGTRYSEEDLYAHIEEVGFYKSLIIGCGYTVELDADKTPILVGEKPTFGHLPLEHLKKKLKTMGVRDFMSQYVNKVTSGATQYFRRDQFRTARWEPWMEDLNGYILTDTATAQHEQACYSVIALVGLDAGNCAYLMDLEVGRWLPSEYVSRLYDLRERWCQRLSISKLLMETNACTQVFEAMIEERGRASGQRFILEKMKRGSTEPSKHQRIQRLTARFENGQFIVLNTVPRTFMDLGQQKVLFDVDGFKDPESGVVLPSGMLVNQFIRFPSTVYRDIPDALADIDAVDIKGRRHCVGTGLKDSRRNQDAMRRRGKVVPMRANVNGRDTWIDVAQPKVLQFGDYDRFDYFGENLPGGV